MAITWQDVAKTSFPMQPPVEAAARDIVRELKELPAFANAIRISLWFGKTHVEDSDLIVGHSKFAPNPVFRAYAVRTYQVKTADGGLVSTAEFLDSETVDDCQQKISQELGKSMVIIKQKSDADPSVPIYFVHERGTVFVRPGTLEFQFELPDGQVDRRCYDGMRTFANLANEWPGSDVQFFNGETALEGSAPLKAMVNKTISVRILYQFVYKYWDAPRYKAYPPDITLADVCSDLTGKDGKEFLVKYRNNNVVLTKPISSIGYAKGYPIILTRLFPVVFQLSARRSVSVEFEPDCTFRQLTEQIATDYPGYEIVRNENWVDQAEIYAVLDSSRPIRLKQVSTSTEELPQLTQEDESAGEKDSSDGGSSSSTAEIGSEDLVNADQYTPFQPNDDLGDGDTPTSAKASSLAPQQASRIYAFRYTDTDEVRSISFEHSATVGQAARTFAREKGQPATLFLRDITNPFKEDLLLSEVVPTDCQVFVHAGKIIYKVRVNDREDRIRVPDGETFRDFRARVIEAFFKGRRVHPNSLGFKVATLKGEKVIKSVKESSTLLAEYWRPEIVIHVTVKEPAYWFLEGGQKPRRKRFGETETMSGMYSFWENRLHAPVVLTIGERRLKSDKTLIVDEDCHNDIISVALVKQKKPKLKFWVRLPGSSSPSQCLIERRETVGEFLGRLTMDSNRTLKIDGSGDEVNRMTVRLTYQSTAFQTDRRLSELKWGKDEQTACEVLMNDNGYTFAFEDRTFQESIAVGDSVEFVEWTISNKLGRDVEVATEDYMFISGMAFGELAKLISEAKRSTIELRPSCRTVFIFEDSKDATATQYLRFDKRARVSEVKAVLCPGGHVRHCHLYYGDEDLADDQEIGGIPGWDRWKPFIYRRKRKDVLAFEEASGKTIDLSIEARKRRIPEVKKELKIDRECDFLVLGEPVRELKQSKRVRIQIDYPLCDYAFEDEGAIETRGFHRSMTFGELRRRFKNSDFNSERFIIFVVNNELVDLNQTLASVPAGSKISVFRSKEEPKTIGDRRKASPDQRSIFTANGRVLVNSDPFFAATDLSQTASVARPPQKFSLRLPFTPDRPEMGSVVRSFYFDYNTTVKDVEEILADVGHLAFPPFALYYQGHRLVDDFLFDIGYDGSAPIDVKFRQMTGRCIWVHFGDRDDVRIDDPNPEMTIHELKSRIATATGIKEQLELVYLGRILSNDRTLEEAKVANAAYVYVYLRVIDPDAEAQVKFVPETFDFVISKPSRSIVSLPYSTAKTAADAKRELVPKLQKGVSEISLIEGGGMFCVQDHEKLADVMTTGKSFSVFNVDYSYQLSGADIKMIEKYIPGRDPATEGKSLFLQCGGNETVFRNSCRRRKLS
jgi:hypothetical protein